MADSRWSTPALIARIDVAMVLDGMREPVTPQRAQRRLVLLDIVSAVDGGRMTSVEAKIRLDELLADVLAEDEQPHTSHTAATA